MTVKGTLNSGDQYSITVASDPATPGMTAAAIVWIPVVGANPIAPIVDPIPPGMTTVHAGVVPPGQALMLDFDLPDIAGAKISVNVTSGPKGAVPTTNVSGSEIGDVDWTFLVLP